MKLHYKISQVRYKYDIEIDIEIKISLARLLFYLKIF